MTISGGRTWHLDAAVVDRYLVDRLDFPSAASVETHLLTCPDCRGLLAERQTGTAARELSAAWAGVRERVEAPTLPWPVRLLRRAGLSEPTAVVLAAARSMTTAWTVATVVILAFSAAAVLTGTEAGTAIFLIIAPLVPVAGVVAAFGSGGDPLAELSTAAPYSAARLVLVRAGGVAVTSAPLAVVVGLVAPGQNWLAVAWLGPALAFVVIVLAASTWVDPLIAGGALALTWTSTVLVALRFTAATTPVLPALQPGYLLLAGVAGLVLMIRIRGLHLPGGAQ